MSDESLTIEQVNGLAKGSKIPRIEGTLQAVYETHRGTNSRGKYAIQNMVLAQGDDTIRVGIFNGPNVDKSMEGEEVAIMCSSNPKGLSGVEATDNEYPKNSGTFNREIRMDRTARIMLLNDAGEKNPPVAAAHNANKAPIKGIKPLPSFRDVIAMVVNVYHESRCKLEELAAEQKVYKLDEQQKHEAAMSCVINVDKRGVLTSVPTTPFYIISAISAMSAKPTPSDETTSEQPEQEA